MESSRHDLAADDRPAQPTPAESAAPPLPRVAGLGETEAGEFAPVLQLASIARLLASALRAPAAKARALVLQRLQSDGAALFVAPGDELAEALPVQAADEWRPALASGAESLAEHHRLQALLLHLSGTGDNMDAAEALWRGVPLLTNDPAAGAFIADDARRSLPALPALRGRLGALEAWRMAAAPGAERSEVEFVRLALALGILADDAVRLFPELPWGFSSRQGVAAPAHQRPQLLALQPSAEVSHLAEAAQAARKAATAALKPPYGFTKGGGWTDDSRAELLRQYETLTAAGLTSEGALIELHTSWGYSKRNDRNGGPLGKVLTRARKSRKPLGKVVRQAR
jgi:hypothetical protein